jgi:hypothetical protein
MRSLSIAPLVILASTLCAMPYAANARLTQRGALGARVVPLRPPTALVVRRTDQCPKNRHHCSGGCCLHEEECCAGKLWTI